MLFVAHICRDRCAHGAYFSARVCVQMVSYDGDATEVLRETARHGTPLRTCGNVREGSNFGTWQLELLDLWTLSVFQ